MNQLRRLSIAALTLTYLQLVFGGIVRVTGSGMGCGDHWPKCNGSWIPPFDNPTVMIEWTHRLLASLVLIAIAAFAWTARRRRAEAPTVERPAAIALALVIGVALLGMVTVKLGNTPLATLAHWTLAMTLLAVLVAAAIRAGALSGEAARAESGTARAVRSLSAGAALALTTVVLGGLVAKTPGAAAACPSFPMCGTTPAGVPAGAASVQVVHRVMAFLLFLHVLAISTAIRRRPAESAAVKRAATAAAGMVLAQVALGAAMVLSAFPTVLRSAHEAAGVAVWMLMFRATYLARVAVKA